MISVTRKSHFNAAHRLHNTEWSDEKNDKFYGLCNNKNFHGHNYDLEVTVKGDIEYPLYSREVIDKAGFFKKITTAISYLIFGGYAE